VALTAYHEPLAVSATDTYMPLTPMFHVHGWGVPYIATMLGMKQVYPGRYEPTTLLNLIRQHGVSFSHCVPTILLMLLNHPASRDVNFNGFKMVIGGAALTKGIAQLAMDRGIQIVGGYGMSETCPIVAVSHIKPEDAARDGDVRAGIITRTGLPIPLVRAAVWSPDDKPLPPGPENVGELVVQSPWLTRGYLRNPEGSAQLWRGGWLHTGDIAYLDSEGYIRITDRLKDVIKIGGEWISTLELENGLSQHPAVKEVAVFAVPDAKWDERPHAEVVLRDEQRGQVTAKELGTFLHGFIDRGVIHKRAILTQIHVVEAIPKTSVGKVDKKALRAKHRPVAKA
jgi:fatty-acyl-CoA synthase